MVNTQELDREDREKIWLKEIRPALAEHFITGKKKYLGEIGETVEGISLQFFCNQTLDISGYESALSEHGIGLSISMFPFPHRDYAGVSLPRTSGRDISTYHPFIKTKHPFAKNQFASLPLYVFGVSLRDFPMSGFLTFYKILLSNKEFIKDELYSKNNFGSDIYNRNHSDFTLANIAICHNLQTQSEYKKYSYKNTFAYETRHIDYNEINKLESLVWNEFEKIGEAVTSIEKNIPRKKLFGFL